jgi:hypothetical protein
MKGLPFVLSNRLKIARYNPVNLAFFESTDRILYGNVLYTKNQGILLDCTPDLVNEVLVHFQSGGGYGQTSNFGPGATFDNRYASEGSFIGQPNSYVGGDSTYYQQGIFYPPFPANVWYRVYFTIDWRLCYLYYQIVDINAFTDPTYIPLDSWSSGTPISIPIPVSSTNQIRVTGLGNIPGSNILRGTYQKIGPGELAAGSVYSGGFIESPELRILSGYAYRKNYGTYVYNTSSGSETSYGELIIPPKTTFVSNPSWKTLASANVWRFNRYECSNQGSSFSEIYTSMTNPLDSPDYIPPNSWTSPASFTIEALIN